MAPFPQRNRTNWQWTRAAAYYDTTERCFPPPAYFIITNEMIQSQSLEFHDLSMQAIIQQVIQHCLPSLFGQHEFASIGLLGTDVLLSEVISVERVEFALQLFVDVCVFAVGISDENGFA